MLDSVPPRHHLDEVVCVKLSNCTIHCERVNDYIQNQVIPEEERSLVNKKEKEGDTEQNNMCIKDENREYKVTIHEVRVHVHVEKQHFIV